jgi:hypothetical protein
MHQSYVNFLSISSIVFDVNNIQKVLEKLDKMTIANLCRQQQTTLKSIYIFKSSWKHFSPKFSAIFCISIHSTTCTDWTCVYDHIIYQMHTFQ